MHRFFPALAAVLLVWGNARADGLERAFWVWHRAAPLAREESAELAREEVRTLFWSVGEMQRGGPGWLWKAPPLAVAGVAPQFRVVPVVRLTSGAGAPFPAEALPGLVERLRAVATPAGELQIDFDCPDRRLGEYAAALGEIRRTIPRVSITAPICSPRSRPANADANCWRLTSPTKPTPIRCAP